MLIMDVSLDGSLNGSFRQSDTIVIEHGDDGFQSPASLKHQCPVGHFPPMLLMLM